MSQSAIEVDWGKYIPNDEKRQYFCRDCSSLIMEGRIARSIHFWEGGGGGEVHNCKVPFCPKCEPEREFQYGPPILQDELKAHTCPTMPAGRDEVTP